MDKEKLQVPEKGSGMCIHNKVSSEQNLLHYLRWDGEIRGKSEH